MISLSAGRGTYTSTSFTPEGGEAKREGDDEYNCVTHL